jgi:gluconate kinase
MKKIFPFLISILLFISVSAQQNNSNTVKIVELEKQKAAAVQKEDWVLANKLKKQIEQLENPTANPNAAKIAELEKQKEDAKQKEDWALANKLKKQIEQLENPTTNPNAAKIAELEKQKEGAKQKEDWALANKLKKQIEQLENPAAFAAAQRTLVKGSNYRETELLNMADQDYATANSYLPAPTNTTNEYVNYEKVKNSTENVLAKDLKYRRSSLYTLMVNDPTRLHANVIKDAFGNSVIPQKFNDHNIGPYMINGQANSEDQSYVITNYLNSNNVAKDIVAKWFNKNADGKFNMDLVAARGMYDASSMDKVIANASARGDAMIADAGEELIGSTFVIVNDFKFTNKEDVAKKVGGGLRALGSLSALAGYDVSSYTNVAALGTTVAGKGYWVKTTSYLYRLVWDEEAAAIFYNNYWTDDNNFDPEKVEAFKNATHFKLRFVGFQTAGADVQSSIFTNKSEEDLIRMATVKATDRAVAKLERQYEEFRTKVPLYSVNPLAAKIGIKEGLEAGDKFEVLQQEITLDGKTIYKRVGVIQVSNNIWDNSLSPEETEQLRQQGMLPAQQYTVFIGSGNFYPGQLIKQIN